MLKPQIWDSGVSYLAGDVVNYASTLYVALENNLDDAPRLSSGLSSSWSPYSQRTLEKELRHNIDENIFWNRVDDSITDGTFTVNLDPVDGATAWTRRSSPGEWV